MKTNTDNLKFTGEIRTVKKYWIFGEIVKEYKYSYIDDMDTFHGVRNETIEYIWLRRSHV